MEHQKAQTLQMRLFHMKVDASKLDELGQVGQHNFLSSIEKEAGTLAMYLGHVPEKLNEIYVIELYKDEASYQEHVVSEHFQAFAQFAKTAVTDREVYSLKPQLLLEKESPLRVTGANSISLRLARIEVKEACQEAFKEIVEDEMKQSMLAEAGVLVMYAAVLADKPSTWQFVEIYRDEAAYESHRKTEPFMNYIEKTTDMLNSKELTVLEASLLVNKGGLTVFRGK